MKCPNCQLEIDENDNFCAFCGFNIKEWREQKNRKQNEINEMSNKENQENKEMSKKEVNSKKENSKREKEDIKLSVDNQVNAQQGLSSFDIKHEVEVLEQKKKRLENEIVELNAKKEQLNLEIDKLKRSLEELNQQKKDLEKELDNLLDQKKEIEDRQLKLDRKEIELKEKEEELNKKYLELVQFENELLEEKKKIEENELNLFLANELKDSSKVLADEVLKNITPPTVLGKEEKIMSLVEFAKEFLQQGMLDAAIHTYKKIEELYYAYANELPKDVLDKLHLQIVSLYDEIELKKSEING